MYIIVLYIYILIYIYIYTLYPLVLHSMVHHWRQRKNWWACWPGFQDNAKKAADFLELGSEAAMQQMMVARPGDNADVET